MKGYQWVEKGPEGTYWINTDPIGPFATEAEALAQIDNEDESKQ